MENMNIKVPNSMPFHPFDMGLIQNIKFVIFTNKQNKIGNLF
jgi:hypothetical protein